MNKVNQALSGSPRLWVVYVLLPIYLMDYTNKQVTIPARVCIPL